MEKNKVKLLVVEDEKKLCDMIAKSSHACLEFLQMKWFFHIIIRTYIQPFNFICNLTSRRH